MDFDHRIAVVTGDGSGIGAAYADLLLTAGGDVGPRRRCRHTSAGLHGPRDRRAGRARHVSGHRGPTKPVPPHRGRVDHPEGRIPEKRT